MGALRFHVHVSSLWSLPQLYCFQRHPTHNQCLGTMPSLESEKGLALNVGYFRKYRRACVTPSWRTITKYALLLVFAACVGMTIMTALSRGNSDEPAASLATAGGAAASEMRQTSRPPTGASVEWGRKPPFTISAEDYNDIYIPLIPRGHSQGNGEEVRAMIMVVSNHIHSWLCGFLATAYLSGHPAVVVGHKYEPYNHLMKLPFFRRAAAQAGLRGHDVVLLLDADAFFTGVNVTALLEDYARNSPGSLEELDALAVREGRQEPPMVTSTDPYPECWAPEVYLGISVTCTNAVDEVYRKHDAYLRQHGRSVQPDRRKLSNPYRYVNSGIIVARVWALAYWQAAVDSYIQRFPPAVYGAGWADQSYLAVSYLELLQWEMTSGVYFKSRAEQLAMRSPLGLPAGMIDLDSSTRFSDSLGRTTEFTTAAWGNCTTSAFPLREVWRSNLHSAYVVLNATMRELYERCGKEVVVYDGLPLPRSRHPSIKAGPLAPPLFSPIPRPDIDMEANGDGPVRHVYPAFTHFKGVANKYSCYRRILYAMGWSLPLMVNETAHRDALAVLSSMEIELWGATRLRQPYSHVCDANGVLNPWLTGS